MSTHTDKRRTLTEFGIGGVWKVCKVIKTYEACLLGEHYHKNKDESFMLVAGDGYITQGDKVTVMQPFKEYFVQRGTLHAFDLSKDALLIGLCTKEFDPTDDYV